MKADSLTSIKTILHQIENMYLEMIAFLEEEMNSLKKDGFHLEHIQKQIAVKQDFHTALSEEFERLFDVYPLKVKNFSSLEEYISSIQDPEDEDENKKKQEVLSDIKKTRQVLLQGTSVIEKNQIFFRVFLDNHKESLNFWNRILAETRASYDSTGHIAQGESVSHFFTKA